MAGPLGMSRRQALTYGGLAAAVPLLPATRRDPAAPRTPLLSWLPQQQVPAPVASTDAPSLAAYSNGLLYMAWRGGPGDNSLWWSYFDGASWHGQQRLPAPVSSTLGPSLAVFDSQLYVAWHGGPGDNSLWWSSAS
jgi:hypothetical protein